MFIARPLIVAALATIISVATAQEPSISQRPGFGGPNAVDNQLAVDELHWDDWKKRLKADHGFSFSMDYTGVLLTASETFSDNTGAGGIARIYGAWDLVDNGAGALVWKFEHRHK